MTQSGDPSMGSPELFHPTASQEEEDIIQSSKGKKLDSSLAQLVDPIKNPASNCAVQ